MNKENTIFTIDVGNTLIHWALIKNGELCGEYKRNLHSELSLLPWGEIKENNYTVVIASALSHINESIKEKCKENNINFFEIKTDNQKIIKNIYPTIGVDRVCDLAAAFSIIKNNRDPIVVFDFGTATTVSVCDLDGKFLGGLILTGFETELNALSAKTFSLPHIEIARECKISELNPLANDTENSMLQGVIIGQIAFVEYYLKLLEQKHKSKSKVVITGGNAPTVCRFFNKYYMYEPCLTLKGIYHCYSNLLVTS